MRSSALPVIGLVAFIPAATALRFTSPSPGTAIDPTQPITVTWQSEHGDPAKIDLHFDNASPDSLSYEQDIASGIPTVDGSCVIPPNTIQNFGTGYRIQALEDGKAIAKANDLTLGAGQDQVSVGQDGQMSFVSKATAIEPPAKTESALMAPGVMTHAAAMTEAATTIKTSRTSAGASTETEEAASSTTEAEMGTTSTEESESTATSVSEAIYPTNGTSVATTTSRTVTEPSAAVTTVLNMNVASSAGMIVGSGVSGIALAVLMALVA